MALFKNHKKINQENKKTIIKLIDKLMDIAPDYIKDLNNMKNNLLSQPDSDNKDLHNIDEQIIASLNKAFSILNNNKNSREAKVYIEKSIKDVSNRSVSATNKKPKEVKVILTEEELQEIMLSQAQDEIAQTGMKYNEAIEAAKRGDMVAQTQAQILYDKYKLANQRFKALSADTSRTIIAEMMKQFTEEQLTRLANRTISDAEMSEIVEKYNQVSVQIAKDTADVSALSSVINEGYQAASYQPQQLPSHLNVPGQGVGVQEMPSSLNIPGQASGIQGMPSNLNVPGANQNAGFNFGNGANPFETPSQFEQETGMSPNQLRATKVMLENAIDKLKDELEDKKDERKELDRLMAALLKKHETLNAAEATQLEFDIDSISSDLDTSDFELKSIQQEILQAQENKALIVKLLSVNSRLERENILKQRFGNNFNVENFAMYIAEQTNRFNEQLQQTDDANAVSRAENINARRTTVDAGSYTPAPKKNYDDLKKRYGIELNNK